MGTMDGNDPWATLRLDLSPAPGTHSLALLLLGTVDQHSPLHQLRGKSHLLERIWRFARGVVRTVTQRLDEAITVEEWNQHGPIAFCLSGPPHNIWNRIAEMLT